MSNGNPLKTEVEALAKKAASETAPSVEAIHYSQAALNLANAGILLEQNGYGKSLGSSAE